MTPTIEASDKSLKLSYLRFVSDSAPGLLVLLLILVAERHLNLPDDAALKALLAVVAFLLATPLAS
ncbi:MAG TPA: hypothetical protein VJ840_12255 [Gemmatimonadaceae bacterium]|nr:hypothetical protein [Gemmatimonadaceae bacterium]